MAYTGSFTSGFGRFNDQQVGEEFAKAVKRANPGFQGIRAGQFFTGEGGTQYKTVAGIDPNQPGWGQMVDPDYQLIGYQQGAPSKVRGSSGERAPGIAILKKIATEAPKPVETSTEEVIEKPPANKVKPGDLWWVGEGKPEPSPADIAAENLRKELDALKTGFQSSIDALAGQYSDMQAKQEERMTALQNQMLAAAQLRDRPTTAGVKMASGAAGNAMQIARRGVTGAFGRRGMRISSLNV